MRDFEAEHRVRRRKMAELEKETDDAMGDFYSELDKDSDPSETPEEMFMKMEAAAERMEAAYKETQHLLDEEKKARAEKNALVQTDKEAAAKAQMEAKTLALVQAENAAKAQTDKDAAAKAQMEAAEEAKRKKINNGTIKLAVGCIICLVVGVFLMFYAPLLLCACFFL